MHESTVLLQAASMLLAGLASAPPLKPRTIVRSLTLEPPELLALGLPETFPLTTLAQLISRPHYNITNELVCKELDESTLSSLPDFIGSWLLSKRPSSLLPHPPRKLYSLWVLLALGSPDSLELSALQLHSILSLFNKTRLSGLTDLPLKFIPLSYLKILLDNLDIALSSDSLTSTTRKFLLKALTYIFSLRESYSPQMNTQLTGIVNVLSRSLALSSVGLLPSITSQALNSPSLCLDASTSIAPAMNSLRKSIFLPISPEDPMDLTTSPSLTGPTIVNSLRHSMESLPPVNALVELSNSTPSRPPLLDLMEELRPRSHKQEAALLRNQLTWKPMRSSPSPSRSPRSKSSAKRKRSPSPSPSASPIASEDDDCYWSSDDSDWEIIG